MPILLRPVEDRDIPAIAAIRAREWETEAYWLHRIGGYLKGEHSPQQALAARAAFVAVEGTDIVGFVAGHTTLRYGCDGELEWIDVIAERRRRGIAGQLLEIMAGWFVEQNALRVCIDPGNTMARSLYAKYGAVALNKHWMVWEDVRLVLQRRNQLAGSTSV